MLVDIDINLLINQHHIAYMFTKRKYRYEHKHS